MVVAEPLQSSEPLSPTSELSHGIHGKGLPTGDNAEGNGFDEGESVEETDVEDGEYDEGYEGDYDPDEEAEAEAMARALGNQIWAELGQNIGDTTPSADNNTTTKTAPLDLEDAQFTVKDDSSLELGSIAQPEIPEPLAPVSDAPGPPPPQASFPTITNTPAMPDPMIETIKTMLSLALSEPHVHYALMTTIVPGPVANGANLYTILSNSVMEGRVNPELAQPLSILISALASGSVLVASEHQYTHPTSQDVGTQNSPLKRKRDPTDEGQAWPVHPPYNPSVQPAPTPQPTRAQPSEELVTRIQSATSGILQVLDPLLAIGQTLNQSVVSSVRRQLHQVYSFVSTCPQQHEGTSGGGTLQEIGGLIQVIGILNEVPIAQAAEDPTNFDAGPPGSNRTTTGTSIYPCATCPKVFSKLSLLRTHERTHSEGRPYRCEYTGCPASFARNHDLRRHEKSHERQMFRCGGCDRLFSRRDALRRHKANDKALDECREAPMDASTVTYDGDLPRVTRVWQNHPESGDWPKESEFEEGEIQPEAIANARYTVGTLYQTLQRHVSKGLNTGGITGQSNNQSSDDRPPGSHASDDPALRTLVEGKQSDPVGSSSQLTLTVVSTKETTDSAKGPEVPSTPADDFAGTKTVSTLPGYGLDDEHTSLLERAIAVAAQAAQAQAEAEAALYEEPYNEDGQDVAEWDEEGDEGERPEAETAKLVC
ncbi:unnamed protein product [Rhizoctonia solani]|uniref:C2H2-type domain-containing protein n=1 Tax=Rhizoctonia solani TaxID=456999 RepID=A0A8H3D8K5_9AGAM|nr:unnamed protein product [Rhizoctonia solani]